MTGILVVDKPAGWTSHDVVAKLRSLFHQKRIGHGGTLDPMATGVLPVFLGQATKAVEFCENAVKRYTASLRLGITTDTQDTTGNILSECPAGQITAGTLSSALEPFRGRISQIPPMYSAIKIGGRKLYEIARKGGTVERPPRQVEIFSLDIIGMDQCDFVLDIKCSKGTYIRTLCNDIGQSLGVGGAMSALRRTEAGSFTEGDAVSMDQISERFRTGQLESLLRPVDSLFSSLPSVTLGEYDERLVRTGVPVKLPLSPCRYRVYSQSGRFLMLGSSDGTVLRSIKNFFTNENNCKD